MSKSIYNALRFMENTNPEGTLTILHVQNKSQSQQNRLVVRDRSGRLANYDNAVNPNLDFRLDNNRVDKVNETTVFLSTSKPAKSSALRAVSINKLIYDFVVSRLGGVYPPFEVVNASFSEGSIVFELTDDPNEYADEYGNVRFPIILNVPTEDAELAMATVDPNKVWDNERPVISVRVDDNRWISLDLLQHMFKTPDGLWWLAIPSMEQEARNYSLLQYNLKILFNADGELNETVREATFYSYVVTHLAANFDPCAGATREVVMQYEGVGSFTVKLGEELYEFADLEDFRVNATKRLPTNIKAKLLNKFKRPDISCDGATSSAYIDATSADTFNVVIGTDEYTNLTYTELVALLNQHECIVKRVGTLPT